MKKSIFNSGAAWLADLAIFIILGLTPLFFNYFFPTSIDLSKVVFFKIFIGLLLFAITWRVMTLKVTIIKAAWKNLIPFFVLFLFLISSLFFSVDITTSWLGSYDRQEGLISWLFYGLWTILIIIYLTSYSKVDQIIKINNFLKVAAWSGLLVSIYAICQLFGLDFITWSEPASATGRAVSSFGQPNYLACWLILVLPFTAYLVTISKTKITRATWLIFFIVQLLALLATGSRAALFIFLGLSVIWLIWFLKYQKVLSRQKLWLVLGSGLVVIFIFLASLFFINKPRLLEITDLKKGSAAVRLDLWQTGGQAFLKKPILGYGLENQSEAYISYYKINDAVYSRPNTYTDRAHNLILDVLLTTGVVGLLFFAYFLFWVFKNLFRALKNESSRYLAAFLIWSLVTYLVSILFNFSVTITNIYFWFIIALSFIIGGQTLFLAEKVEKKFELAHIIITLSAGVIFVYCSLIEVNRLVADYYYNKALNETMKSEYFSALVLKDYLDETHPNAVFSNYYNRGLSLRFLESLPTIIDKSSVLTVLHYLNATEKILPSTNFENKFVKAFILGGLGRRYESEQMFDNLSLLSPELPKIYLAWGDSLLYNHDPKGAIIKFNQALALLPESDNKYLNQQQSFYLNLYKTQINSRIQTALATSLE